MDNLGVIDVQEWLPDQLIWWACVLPVPSAAQTRPIISILDRRKILIQGLIVPYS